MIRWILVIFLGLVLINAMSPWLQRIGLGKLPGDFRFRWLGRDWFIPVTTTIVLSLIFGLVARFI
jgi:hypothetical protein